MKKYLLTLTLLGTAILTLSACSSNSTSKSKSTEQTSQTTKVSDSTDSKNDTAAISLVVEATQKTIDKQFKDDATTSETYKDITVSSEGKDTIVATYVFQEGYLSEEDILQVKETLEQQRDTLVTATKTDADKFNVFKKSLFFSKSFASSESR